MSLLVCNLLIVITSLYRLLRTAPVVVEVGKSPIIPNISSPENSGSEDPTSSDTSERERATAEGSVSGIRRGGGGNDDTGSGSYPRMIATSSTSTTDGIELTELYESDLSFA